jgi:N6-L-threonylcarbamoyladenine synthase
MRILAIETSCDETAIAIVEVDGPRIKTLANETLSQAALHSEYGGVFPTLAKREHARTIAPLLELVLKKAGLSHHGEAPNKEVSKEILGILSREPELGNVFLNTIGTLSAPAIDRIVVTRGPGLEPALWVGINVARALGLLWDIPVIPVNHMEGHILAAVFDNTSQSFASMDFPTVALLISGGHTELVQMNAIGKYALLGETKDDAVGECFDKVARMLGLPYPGGPEISRLALRGNPGVYQLPRPMLHSGDLSFSFSGLKTAVLYLVKKLGNLTEEQKADIAREFEDAVTEVLTIKCERAIESIGARALIIGGGVSANTRIRESLLQLAQKKGVTFFAPERMHSTDNAFMIALAGAHAEGIDGAPLDAFGGWRIHTEKHPNT